MSIFGEGLYVEFYGDYNDNKHVTELKKFYKKFYIKFYIKKFYKKFYIKFLIEWYTYSLF